MESYRDEAGKPRQRTIATVGRVDETGGAVDSLLSGLLRATGRAAVDVVPGDSPELSSGSTGIRFDSSLAFGDVFALDRLWHELGFNEIAGLLRSARLSFDAEAPVRAMLFNRLCDATSKLGLLRWLQTGAPFGSPRAMAGSRRSDIVRIVDWLTDELRSIGR